MWEQRDLASFAGMHRAPLCRRNTGPIRVARQLVTLHDLFFPLLQLSFSHISYLVPDASSYVSCGSPPQLSRNTPATRS
jgi:hypothetical protein